MHNCREVENKLVDLVFDELGADEQARLMSEVQRCQDCLVEFNSLTGTLSVFDRGVEATLPDESFWPRHHASLRQRLGLATDATKRPEPFWKRLLTLRLPVPVPVAALIVIAFVSLSILALRRSNAAAPAPAIASQPSTETMEVAPRFIEVPVLREKVVTRTVYVEKSLRERNSVGTQPNARGRIESPLVARDDRENDRNDFSARVSLRDFQPPDEMRIRIIKRSNRDEN